MKTKYVLVLSVTLLLVAMGCSLIDSALSNVTGTSNAGTVANMWSDVPQMGGLTKANIGLPLAGQVAIKAMSQGNFEFIAFTTTQTPQDVLNFYTNARMQAAGWTAQDTGGCNAGATSGASGEPGGICFFVQTTGAKQSALFIIVAQDAQTKQTQVFFARVYNPATPTPQK